MDNWTRVWDFFSDAVIGAIGALLALQFNKHSLAAWRTAITFIGTGAVIAFFIAPLIMKYLNIEQGTAAAVAFLIGAFGGSVFAAVLKAIADADLWEFFKSIVRSRLGVSETPGNEK